MTKLRENRLVIDFVGAQYVLKFDQNDHDHPEFHDLQNMPRVDFIVENKDSIYFIEIKDPGQPGAADVGGTKFLKKIIDGTLEASLIEKYIFTFWFRWAENCLEKSVHYVSLITLESGALQPIIDRLDTQLALHFAKKSNRWSRDPLASCQVHNLETWPAVFPDWPITRLPATGGA